MWNQGPFGRSGRARGVHRIRQAVGTAAGRYVLPTLIAYLQFNLIKTKQRLGQGGKLGAQAALGH